MCHVSIGQQAFDTDAFTRQMETLRKKYSIPSLSIGVVYNNEIVYKKGLGFADIGQQIVPDENTIYHIASVTKTFGAIILMQLVEQGKVKLTDPVTQYNIHLGARWNDDLRIQVKHLLTHTSQGNTMNAFKPGYSFSYNGDYYSMLGKVIQQGSGRSFGDLLVANIIKPLGLNHTAPTVDDSENFRLTGYDSVAFRKQVARGYKYNKHIKQWDTIAYPVHFSPAAGLMSSVVDLAAYSNAIDEGNFLQDSTWEKMFSPFVTKRGKTLHYGYGWFVKNYKGVKYLWHTGLWHGISALFIKVPENKLTFIVFANSEDLNDPFYAKFPIYFKRSLHKNLKASPFARSFIKDFVKK